MTQNEIRLLYDYDTWADLKLLEVIAELTTDQYGKGLGSSFGGIHGTFVHLLSANKIWLARWTGKTSVLLKAKDFPTVEVKRNIGMLIAAKLATLYKVSRRKK
jgi:uncharacterized damage-inducible protein DinB